MLNIIIFGAPGSGKGTQSDLIKQNYNLAHISTGDVLRQEMKNETELGKTAKGYIEKGQLVPDDLICDMLDHTLDTLKAVKGVIFDGFPRTIPQAEALEKILVKHGMDEPILFDLQATDEVLIKRLLERGKISGRSDDNEETIQARLKVYYAQTSPLAAYYQAKGKRIVIEDAGSIPAIFDLIKEEIDKINNEQ